MAWDEEESVRPGSRSRGWQWKAKAGPPPLDAVAVPMSWASRWGCARGGVFPRYHLSKGFPLLVSWGFQGIQSQGTMSSIARLRSRAGSCLPRRDAERSSGSTDFLDPLSSGLTKRRRALEHQDEGSSTQLLARRMKAGRSMCRAQPRGAGIWAFGNCSCEVKREREENNPTPFPNHH